MMVKNQCSWCYKDYDPSTQSSHCPHEVRPVPEPVKSYAQGQHAERQRTMQLIGEVRNGCGVGGNTVLDRLVMAITSQELPDVRKGLRADDPISEILQLPRFGIGYENETQEGRTYVALTEVLSIVEKARNLETENRR